MRRFLWVVLPLLLALLVALSGPLGAQTRPEPRAPLLRSWPRVVADLRGATSGVPSDVAFYPPLPGEVLVPSRGFGLDAGGHVYGGKVGPARLGFGANVILVRATQVDITTVERLIAPQVSFNFGTPDGWSYISGGLGAGAITGRVTAEGVKTEQPSGTVAAINVGGGARWFMTGRVAFTFDLRLHRLGAGARDGQTTPAAMLGAASAGFSFR
jgi:hypothetical protein